MYLSFEEYIIHVVSVSTFSPIKLSCILGAREIKIVISIQEVG